MLLDRPPETHVVLLDDNSVLFPCSATTDSTTELVMQWYKGSETVKSLGDERLLSHKNGNLEINLLDLSMKERMKYQTRYKLVC